MSLDSGQNPFDIAAVLQNHAPREPLGVGIAFVGKALGIVDLGGDIEPFAGSGHRDVEHAHLLLELRVSQLFDYRLSDRRVEPGESGGIGQLHRDAEAPRRDDVSLCIPVVELLSAAAEKNHRELESL